MDAEPPRDRLRRVWRAAAANADDLAFVRSVAAGPDPDLALTALYVLKTHDPQAPPDPGVLVALAECPGLTVDRADNLAFAATVFRPDPARAVRLAELLMPASRQSAFNLLSNSGGGSPEVLRFVPDALGALTAPRDRYEESEARNYLAQCADWVAGAVAAACAPGGAAGRAPLEDVFDFAETFASCLRPLVGEIARRLEAAPTPVPILAPLAGEYAERLGDLEHLRDALRQIAPPPDSDGWAPL